MNALRQVRLGFRRAALHTPLLSSVLFFILAGILAAQTVDVSVPGIVSLSSTKIYTGKYVAHATDGGFIWLDSVAMTGGFVQAVGHCGVGTPTPVTNLYTKGDCSGITSIGSDGNYVVANNFNGQCSILQNGCGGAPYSFTGLGFRVGTWQWDPSWTTPVQGSPGGQSADPQGRTWGVQVVNPNLFRWFVTGGGPAIPIASAVYTNLSSTTGTNYFGDKFQIADNSASATPITSVAWDINNTGTFSPDTAVGTAKTLTGYLPCSPKSGGNFATGQSCGVPNTPATGSQSFAEKSTNQAGNTSQNIFVSAPIAFVCPQIRIAGYTGFSGACAESGGTLSVLSGGTADARLTQGNVNDPSTSFSWAFSPGGSASGQNPVVPAGASSFALTVTYPGGWQATASGAVAQTDLVAAFSLVPNPVLVSGTLTLTNQMQAGSSTSVTSVTYAVKQSTLVVSSGTLAASFSAVGGTAQVAAPGGSPAAYTMEVTYRFDGPRGVGQTSVVSQSFSTTTWNPAPQINISPAPFCTSSCQLTVGTAYSLSDSESIPISPHPGAQWDLVASSGTTSIGTPADANALVSWTPTATCTSNCSLRVTVSGAFSSVPVVISSSAPPPPPPPAILSVTLSGPATGTAGQAVSFTANATGATGPVTYTWNWGENPLGGLQSGPATNSHVYARAGSFAVFVQATSGTSQGSATASISIAPGGPPAPSTGFSIAGADLNPLNGLYSVETGKTVAFTAVENNAVSWVWSFGDGATGSGQSVTHVYTTAGSRSVTLTVTGNGSQTAGTASANISFNITVPPFRAVIVPGAASLDDGMTTWGTDVSVTNPSSSTVNLSLGFVPLLPDAIAPSSLDLRNLQYTPVVPLAPGGSWSGRNVIAGFPGGGNNKGTFVIKYDVGLPPQVSARVYFAPKNNSGNVSYGSAIPAYDVDGSGGIKPQGFVSPVIEAGRLGASTLSTEAALGTVTVNKTGTGSGTVTSDPAGISCGATCSASFPGGGPVILSGVAAPGSVFVGITGCSSYVIGQCIVDGTAGGTVTAQFDASTGGPTGGNPTLTVTVGGSGTVTSSPAGISCPAACSAQYTAGTVVTLTPTPATNFTFSGWGGACSGTGSCSVNLTADQAVLASFAAVGAAPASSDQVLIGLRSNDAYRFGVTLFNSGGATGTFRVGAADEGGAPVLVSDGNGGLVPYREFSIRPYQQVYLRDPDLGLDKSPNRRYVLKATRTSSTGTLLAFGTALDRRTNDMVQVADDSQASAAESGLVSYYIAGVSRYDSSYGAHWRTGLSIYNRGTKPRNLYLDYVFSGDGQSEHTARVGDTGNYIPILPDQLLATDDIIAWLASVEKRVDLSGSSAGVLRIYYAEDPDSATRPLIISARNYDDQPTGTAGSQLGVYTRAQAAGSAQKLYLPGIEESERYRSQIGVFTPDAGPVTGRIVAVAPDGSEVGAVGFTLGGGGLHYGQLDLLNPNLRFNNPNRPVTIRIDQINGGRVSAYGFTVDKVTLDTNFIQGLPQ